MQLWFGCVSGNSLLPNLEDICKKKKNTHRHYHIVMFNLLFLE